MWELDHKEGWELKNWCFQTVVLEKTLESPLDSKGIQPVHPKRNQSLISLEGLMLKLKPQYFGHLMRRTDSLEKTLMLGKIESRKRRGQTEDEMVGWHHWLNGHDFEQSPGVGDGQGAWHATVHGVTKSQIWLKNWTEIDYPQIYEENVRFYGHFLLSHGFVSP